MRKTGKQVAALALNAGFEAVVRSGGILSPRPPERCGLYVWVAADGAAYVGKSVRVMSRLAAHRRVHPDIVWAAVRDVDREDLDREEARMARRVEALAPMRNIKLVAATVQTVPYDLAVARAVPEPEPMVEQAARAARAWRLFCRLDGVDEDIANLRRFVEHVIPNPWATEGRHWSVTVFPEGGLRANCGQQEVMTSGPGRGGHTSVRLLCPDRLDWRATHRLYATQSWEHVLPQGRFERFAKWEPLRAFAVHLMRHITAMNARSHCPQALRETDLPSN